MNKILSTIICLLLISNVNSQITNGLIAYFPFDNNFDDLSTSTIILTNNGTTFGMDRNGLLNNAIVLNGSTNYVSFNDNDVKTNLPITISSWVYVNSFATFINAPIFYSDTDYGNYTGYAFGFTSAGNVFTQIGGNLGNSTASNRRTFVTNNSISTGAWHHVVGVIRAYNDMEIYVDCQYWAGSYNGSGPTTMVYSTTNSRVGGDVGTASYPNGYLLNGSIDQLAIWNRELAPSELTFLCDTDNTLSLHEELSVEKSKEIIKVIDFMGRETEYKSNTPLILMYSDGTTKRVVEIEQ